MWGFIDFEGVNYLIFREKVQEFSPRSLPDAVLFDFPKAQRHYPTILTPWDKSNFGGSLNHGCCKLSRSEIIGRF
nr:hypothetical protein [Microcystis aeruginosa]